MLDRHVNRIVDRNLKCSCSPLEKGLVLSIKFQWDESFEHSTAQLRVYWVKLWGAVVPRPLAGWWRQTVEAGATGSTSASARRKASSGACQGKGRALFVQRSRRDIDQTRPAGSRMMFFFQWSVFSGALWEQLIVIHTWVTRWMCRTWSLVGLEERKAGIKNWHWQKIWFETCNIIIIIIIEIAFDAF